jgi:3-deoxy-D-manno-octulosonic-acid transferase
VVENFLNQHPTPITQHPTPITQHPTPITLHPTKVFVAGSSWQPDEEIFIRYFREHPGWKLIIAPHVIGEDHLQQIEKLLDGWNIIRYTSQADNTIEAPSGAEGGALVINCFGLLSSIYRYADVCYVGGGFGVGIHNVLEAAVWGVPVIFGPNNQKFQEAQGLKACGGGFEISSYEDFERLMQQFETDETARQEACHKAAAYVKEHAGATNAVLQASGLLKDNGINQQ